MNRNGYQEERRVLVDPALGEFILPRYGDELLELAHAASLVKDAIMYRGQNRRSATSDWQRFGFGLGRLTPGLILRHAMLFTQVHGPGP